MSKRDKKNSISDDFVYEFTEEKLEEFRFMSAEARLQWLEEANNFIHKFLDRNKRINWDKRFE